MSRDNQIHVDLETLGLAANAKILSIGAVFREKEFYAEIDIGQYNDSQFSTTQSTLDWWEDRGGFQPTVDAESPFAATGAFAKWVSECMEEGAEEIWANSPSFDCEILRYHMRYFSLHCPWKFWQERDVRTVKSLAHDLRLNIRQKENPHNALQDARNQQEVVGCVYSTLISHCQHAREYLENHWQGLDENEQAS